MKGAISFVIFIGLMFAFFIYMVNLEKDYMRRCTEAGGSPVPGKTMCLKRDMVVYPQ